MKRTAATAGALLLLLTTTTAASAKAAYGDTVLHTAKAVIGSPDDGAYLTGQWRSRSTSTGDKVYLRCHYAMVGYLPNGTQLKPVTVGVTIGRSRVRTNTLGCWRTDPTRTGTVTVIDATYRNPAGTITRHATIRLKTYIRSTNA